MGIKTTQNFTLISKLLRKMQKFANKKFTCKRSVQNWSLFSSILLTCKSFWQLTFSRCTFFQLFPRIWNQRKILRFFDTHMLKKTKKNIGIMEYIYEYFLEIEEYKSARNGFTNWKTCLTNKRILFGIFLLVNPIKLWKSLYPTVQSCQSGSFLF